MSDILSFQGYDIPFEHVRMTGGGPEAFEGSSAAHISILQRAIGIEPSHKFLEIGCGIGRDAIPLTGMLTRGRYLGIDIIGPSIDWCRANITPRHSNFVFHHFDVQDQLHNPGGRSKMTDFRLPLPDAHIDRIILWSVFTHMFHEDMLHYMKEFARVLKPGGLVFATVFIVDDAILAAARKTNLTPFDLRFEHAYGEGCLINDPAAPAGAVAYTPERLRDLVAASGLRLKTDFIHGSWSGHFPTPPIDPGQDAMILVRP